MARNCIVVNLDRCTGCFGCEVACKMENGVALGERWSKVFTVGPVGEYPDMTRYALPTMCQQCENAPCVSVCPTGASYRDGNNVVLVDKEKCIGCKYCMMACPYGVRSWNIEERVVEKCTLCEQRTSQGELPQCVAQCGSRARFFGDLDEGLESFQALAPTHDLATPYEEMMQNRTTLGEWVEPFTEADVYHLTDTGNGPKHCYILRNRKWQGEE